MPPVLPVQGAQNSKWTVASCCVRRLRSQQFHCPPTVQDTLSYVYHSINLSRQGDPVCHVFFVSCISQRMTCPWEQNGKNKSLFQLSKDGGGSNPLIWTLVGAEKANSPRSNQKLLPRD